MFSVAVAGPAYAQIAQEDETLDLVERQRSALRSASGLAPCPPARRRDEIVVCGHRGPDPNRVAEGSEAAAGARVAGEAPDAASLLALGAQSCNSLRKRPEASRLDLLAVAATAATLAASAVKGRAPERAPKPLKACG